MQSLATLWYGKPRASSRVLLPLAWLYCAIAVTRRRLFLGGVLPVTRLPIPLIVVGNLTVGGTGKTPLVLWLAEFLRGQGYRPGIVCRGYKGQARRWPQGVPPEADPTLVGDEAALLARRCQCPVVAAGPDRVAGARMLAAGAACNLLLSDDGLQHLAMGRDIEITVVDGLRRYGNGRCLPAGPLREPLSRLKTVDIQVANGSPRAGEFEMRLVPGDPVQVADATIRRSLADFGSDPIHALCGIGHPERFFQTLEQRGLRIIRHPFPDHHPFTRQEITFRDGLPVLMTEKDAVKCRDFASAEHWYLPVSAELPAAFGDYLLTLLRNRLQEAPPAFAGGLLKLRTRLDKSPQEG